MGSLGRPIRSLSSGLAFQLGGLFAKLLAQPLEPRLVSIGKPICQLKGARGLVPEKGGFRQIGGRLFQRRHGRPWLGETQLRIVRQLASLTFISTVSTGFLGASSGFEFSRRVLPLRRRKIGSSLSLFQRKLRPVGKVLNVPGERLRLIRCEFQLHGTRDHFWMTVIRPERQSQATHASEEHCCFMGDERMENGASLTVRIPHDNLDRLQLGQFLRQQFLDFFPGCGVERSSSEQQTIPLSTT